MGAVAVEQQLNTSSKASRRKDQIPVPPKQYKDTTRTRYNAIRHGILAASVILPGENLQQFQDLRAALGKDLGVVGMVEEMWLDQLTSCYWRLQRIHRAEADLDAKLDLLHRYEVSLRNESKGLIAEIRAAQRLRHNEYFHANTNLDNHEKYIASASRHEARFWETVQDAFDESTPTPQPPNGAAESRVAAVPAAIPLPAAPRGAAVPAAIPPPAPEPAPEVPVTDAAVRSAIESQSDYVLGGRVQVPQVRAFVSDRLGLMARNEGV